MVSRSATAPPLVVIRLWPEHHRNRRLLQDIVAVMRLHPGCCDEVWFCTEFGFPPLSAHQASASLLKSAAEIIRRAGYLPGLQIANTLGHFDSDRFPCDGISWRTMVGHDGQVARMCNCPRDPRLHDYLRAMMCAYAECNPSSVWIDDDLRMQHHPPLRYACFCDYCITDFSRQTSRDWARQNLVCALGADDGPDLRAAWAHFNQESLATVAQVISQAVHDVAPDCRMGLQHAVAGPYVGGDLKAVYRAMTRASGHPSGSRPGAGYYTDHAPRQMIDKAMDIAQQIAQLPEGVDTIRPEVENYPHLSMGKTPHGTAVEASLYLASGCNGLSFAVLCSGLEPLDYYATILQRIAAHRPFWLRYTQANAGTVPAGLCPAYDLTPLRRPFKLDDPGSMWRSVNLSNLHALTTLGMPICMSPGGAVASLLSASAIDGLSDARIDQLLRGGAMMDGTALARLHERGLGQLVGVWPERPQTLDSLEVLTADPINADYAGRRWELFLEGDPRQYEVYRFEPTIDSARVLGEYVSRDGRTTGIASLVAPTPGGGRVALFGYEGWRSLVNAARRAQLLGAADWVSGGRLPVIVQTPAQILVVPHIDDAGHLRSLFLLNITIDQSPPLQLRLRNPAGTHWTRIAPAEAGLPLTSEGSDAERTLTLPPLAPWSVVALVPGDML